MEIVLKIFEDKFKLLVFVLLTELLLFLLFFLHPFLSLLPIAFFTGIVGFYYGFQKGPIIWIMVMVFSTGLDIWGQIAGGVTIFHVAWFFSIVTTIIYSLTHSRVELKYIYPISKPFFIFILIAFLSLIYSPNFTSGLQIVVQSLALYLFFIIIANFIKTKNQIFTIFFILLFVNVFQTFLLIYQLLYENVSYFATSTVESSSGFRIYRPSGTFDDPNVLATYMLYGMIYSISFLMFTKANKLIKTLLSVALMISFIGIVLTFSRSGWLALLFGIAIILYYSKNKKIILYGVIVLSSFLIYSIIFTPYGELIVDRFTSITDLMNDPSIRVRIALIKSSFSMFLDHPFLGIGFRGYPMLYDFYLDPIVPQVQLYVKEPHTLWPTLLAEMSIWGVIAVAAFFLKFMKESYSMIKRSKDDFSKAIYIGIFSVFIAMNIDFLFYGFLFPHFNLFWLNFALFYAIKDNYLNEKF